MVVVISWSHRRTTIVENATTQDTMLGHARNLEPTQALVKHVDGGLALEVVVAMEEELALEGAVAVEEGLALEGAMAVEEGLALEGTVAVDPVVLGLIKLIGEGLSTCFSIRMVEIM